jgi:purine nucleosidase
VTRLSVVGDTDTGIDDALALLWLVASPRVEIVAVGSTHGNCRADQAAHNALLVLEARARPGPRAHPIPRSAWT